MFGHTESELPRQGPLCGVILARMVFKGILTQNFTKNLLAALPEAL